MFFQYLAIEVYIHHASNDLRAVEVKIIFRKSRYIKSHFIANFHNKPTDVGNIALRQPEQFEGWAAVLNFYGFRKLWQGYAPPTKETEVLTTR